MESIKAETRTIFGKSVKNLRQKGMLPAVVYGKGKETQSITIPYTDFLKLWKSAGESTLLSLQLQNQNQNVLVHDVAFDPISGNPIHVDFYTVDMTHKLRVNIPIEFINEDQAIKATGGILIKVLHELHIEALPGDLPHILKVDVSTIQSLQDMISVKDIVSPLGTNILNDPEEIIVKVQQIVAETEEAPAVAIDLSSIEVVKKGKEEVLESSDAENKDNT